MCSRVSAFENETKADMHSSLHLESGKVLHCVCVMQVNTCVVHTNKHVPTTAEADNVAVMDGQFVCLGKVRENEKEKKGSKSRGKQSVNGNTTTRTHQ